MKRLEKLVESMPDTAIQEHPTNLSNGVAASAGSAASNLAVNAASVVGGQAVNLAGWAFTSLATRVRIWISISNCANDGLLMWVPPASLCNQLASGGETPTGEITPTNTVANDSTISAVNAGTGDGIADLSQRGTNVTAISRVSMLDNGDMDETDGWGNDDLIDMKQNDEWGWFFFLFCS